MYKKEVIIIGAGASGLMAALTLCKAGVKVTVLEARNRLGGRIETIHDPRFSLPVERGAEFIHGHLPVTHSLLKDYGLKNTPTSGEMWNIRGGEFLQGFGFTEGSDTLEERLRELKEDMSVQAFLDTYFTGDNYIPLHNWVRGFVKGFDLADPSTASTFTFRDEWLEELEDGQYRVSGGYGKLTDAMAVECKQHGCEFHLSMQVKEISWKPGEVQVVCNNQKQFSSDKVIITVPLGVLTAEPESNSAIRFNPPIPEKLSAAASLGFGTVIKVILQFDEAFWNNGTKENKTGNYLEEPGFIFSDALIPTWWTQLPDKAPIITGWFGGPEASESALSGDKAILHKAMDSLAFIFSEPVENLTSKLKASCIGNWKAEPYSLGGYTYATVGAEKARSVLNTPENNTLFFAGEALYTGKETGTVEAALASGLECAKAIISNSKG